MEPITTVGAGLAIIGSKDLLLKILGPTADYMGGEIQGLVEKCNINLDNIFKKAESKLGDRLEQDGKVSPRVLKHILDEGRFCEDELTAEYYGGVLAASKSNLDNDDRGVSFLKQLETMSSYQIRLHYILYFCIHKEFSNTELNIGSYTDCQKMELYFTFESLRKTMSLDNSTEGWNILTHAAVGLHKLGLTEDHKYGSVEHLQKYSTVPTEVGIMLTPNLAGSELFLWGFGFHGLSGHELLELNNDLTIESVTINDIYTKSHG